MTGFTSVDYSIGTKWLETLKEIAPKVSRVGVLRDPTIPAGSGQLGAIQGAAAVFGVTVTALDVREPDVIVGRIFPTISSAAWLVPVSICSTRSSVGRMIGRKSV